MKQFKMREKLIKFIEYNDGEKIRAALHNEAKRIYRPKHADKYIDFIQDNVDGLRFNINHPQSVNHPYYLTLFTVKSQHVMGDCIEECLDKAIEA